MNANIENELKNSMEYLFGNEKNPLLLTLRFVCPNLQKAYVLNWIPEQEEDIYDVLIDKNIICTIEIRRGADFGEIKKYFSVREFKMKNRSKEKNRKLDVALKLFEN